MKKKFDFQGIALSFPIFWQLWPALCGLVMWVMVLPCAGLGNQVFGQEKVDGAMLTSADFDLTLSADSADGILVYRVTCTLKPNIDFSGYHGLKLGICLALSEGGVELVQHAGQSAFETTHFGVTVPGSGSTAYVAEWEAFNGSEWGGDVQPWVSWSFEVADSAPLCDLRHGLVQVDVIEGLRLLQGSDPAANLRWPAWPNPCKDRLCVQLPQQVSALLSVIDAAGHVVVQAEACAPEACLDVQALPAGTYLLRCTVPGEMVRSILFVRE